MPDNKPQIYAFCNAGCKWETVHKEDWVNSVTYYPLEKTTVDNEEKYVLELGKTYKINRTGAGVSTVWGFTIKLPYKDNGIASEYSVALPTMISKNIDSLTFKLIEIQDYADLHAYDVKFIYAINGEETNATLTHNAIHEYEANTTGIATIGGTPDKVFVLNEDAEVTLNPLTVFIRYADDSSGANMTATYTNQHYMGTYVGEQASATASDYTWVKFVSDDAELVATIADINARLRALENN